MRLTTSVFTTLLLVTVFTNATAQSPNPGNTLITPVRSTQTFLIDINLNTLRSWEGDNGAGHTVYLLPDFSVLRGQGDPNGTIGVGGGSGGHLQRIAANGDVLWDYFFSDDNHQGHHDIQPLPNGNVLQIAWERVPRDDAIAAGRTAETAGDLFPTLIVELQPVGLNDANIVWEWRIWDHIIQDSDPAKPNYGVIADHPERVDINLGNVQRSWDHGNFIDYDPVRDQIVYSSRRMDEVYVIDHSTTTEEARGTSGGRWGKGGDILYRWGNPQNYGRGTADDHVFWGVHGANFIDHGLPGAGGILAFNNGNREGTANDSSSVIEIQPPRDGDGNYILEPGQAYGPAEPNWKYDAGRSFYSLRYGSAFRLPNGNTLICDGVAGFIFEVTPELQRVWTYLEPIGQGVFSAERYWPGRFDVAGVIDVEPGRCPNVVRAPAVGSDTRKARFKVAVIGSDLVDVSLIDLESILLEGVAPLRVKTMDHVRADCDRGHGGAGGGRCGPPGEPDPDGCTSSCQGPDGHDDLVLFFSSAEVRAAIAGAGDPPRATLTAQMVDGRSFEASDCIEFGGPAARSQDRGPARPGIVSLSASPNPFNPATTIRFELSGSGVVRLRVYDVAGRRVATLVDAALTAGVHDVEWDAGDVPSGIYFYRLRAGDAVQTRRLVLLK